MSAPLRVALVTSYPVDPGRIAGGVQAVSVRLVAELCRIPDLDLQVVHCHSDISENSVVRRDNVTFHYIAQTRRRVIPNMTTAIRLVADRLREITPNVVHAHDSPAFALAALRAGYHPIWTLHGVTRAEARYYPGLFHVLSHALWRRYEHRAFARVHELTAVTRYLVDVYETETSGRWHVIENPAPAALFELPRRPLPGRVLVPAAVIPLKDPLTLIRAAAIVHSHLPVFSLHLAGALPDSAYAETIGAEIERLGLQDTVSLLGALDMQRLYEEFSAAAVVALPSRQEAAPMAVIEAMAAGIPVLASRVGGIPYLVNDGLTGRLAPPGDPASWATALQDLLGNPVLAESMGARARLEAQQRFAAGRIAAQYMALYREVAG